MGGRRARIFTTAAALGLVVPMAGAVALAVSRDAVSHADTEPPHWRLIGSTPDGKGVRIVAEVTHGGCTVPRAVVRRPDAGRITIRVGPTSYPCVEETAELRTAAVITVGLPLKFGLPEVTLGGPGYAGIAADPSASENPQRYPGVTGLPLSDARKILAANGINDVSIVGRDDASATVRVQYPPSGDLTWRAIRKPLPLRRATLVVLPAGEWEYPWPVRMTCEQAGRLRRVERAALDRSLRPRGC